MRRWQALFVLLLLAPTEGCLWNRVERARSFFDPFRALGHGPVGDDVIQIDVALVERPIGDRYLNRELWDLADEQIVGFERKAALEDNGFRVGLIGGMPPAGLQALLTSERSCANPRRLRLRAGDPTPITLGPTVTQCRFELRDGGKSDPVDLEKAQCQLQVTPALTDDGKVTLRFTPHINHGETALAPRPVKEPSGLMHWQLATQQPSETYSRLAWDVTLTPNDYVVVGTRIEHIDTLGQRSFLLSENAAPVQRLLVIRACRVDPGIPPRDGGLGKAPPLALQAGWSSARGTAP